MKRLTLLAILFATIISKQVFAQPGALDSTFGSDGIVTILPDQGYGQDVAMQSDGKIVVGGEYSTDGFVVARFNDDGSLDSTFGVNGIAQTIVGLGYNQDERIAIQGDGKIVVGGVCANFDGYFNCALLRFNTNGTLDNTFGSGGTVIYYYKDPHQYDNSAYDLAITPDQKIMTAGSCVPDFAAARFNSNGTLDNTFGTNGIATTPIGNPNASAFSIEIQSDGKAVLGGGTYSTTTSSFAIVRYNVDGSLDNSFSVDGRDTIYFHNPSLYEGGANGRAVLIQSDGKIVIAGAAGSTKDHVLYAAIARYNVDGTLDNSFGVAGKEELAVPGDSSNIANTLSEQSDGKVVLAGATSFTVFPNPHPTVMLMRVLQDGSLDNSFGNNGSVVTYVDTIPNSGILSIAMDQQQRIVATGASEFGLTTLRYLSGLNVGINNLPASNSSISIFPNPASTVLQIHLPAEHACVISIFNLFGEKVKQEKVSGREATINVNDLPDGIYLITLNQGNHQQSKKLVVEH